MRVRRALLPLLVVTLLLPAAPAAAGGWDGLSFPRHHYLVGHVASVRSQFFAGALEGVGPLDGGPYYAYLLTKSRGSLFGMIDAPEIPAGAIRLGTLSILGPIIADDGYPYGVASLSFTVPDVPSGSYPIGFCDDPCMHSAVGWLAWGQITIVHTPYEGRLLRRSGRDELRMSRLKNEVRRADRAADDARAELSDTKSKLRTLARESSEATTPIELRAVGPIVQTTRTREPSVTWWIALLALLSGLGAGLIVGRRRSERVVVPDIVPDDLEEREAIPLSR